MDIKKLSVKKVIFIVLAYLALGYILLISSLMFVGYLILNYKTHDFFSILIKIIFHFPQDPSFLKIYLTWPIYIIVSIIGLVTNNPYLVDYIYHTAS